MFRTVDETGVNRQRKRHKYEQQEKLAEARLDRQ